MARGGKGTVLGSKGATFGGKPLATLADGTIGRSSEAAREPRHRVNDQVDDYSAYETAEAAALYDAVFAGRDDAAFWLARAAESGGPVLELGCGTGRVLLPLARAGHEVTGTRPLRPDDRALPSQAAARAGSRVASASGCSPAT